MTRTRVRSEFHLRSIQPAQKREAVVPNRNTGSSLHESRPGIGRRELLLSVLAAAAPARRAVAGAGPYRIDCQSHIYPPELLALLEKRKSSPRALRENGELYVLIGDWRRRVLPKHTDVEAKLADMDAAAIQTAALSINDPGPELFGADGTAVARLANDFLSGVARAH